MYKVFLWVVLTSAISFGSNVPWAWNFYSLLVSVFFLFYCIIAFMRESFFWVPSRLILISCLLFVIPLLWAVVQVSDNVFLSWRHPFWDLAAQILPSINHTFISLTPEDTVSAIFRLLSYGLVFFISLQFNRQADVAEFTFNSIAYFGFALAVYGLIIYFGNFNSILWFEKKAYLGFVTSTFVNRNSYATYAGIVVLCTFPLMLHKVQSGIKYGLKTLYSKQYFIEQVLIEGWLPLIMIITGSTALLLTQSRGGALSALVSVLVVFLMLVFSRRVSINVLSILFVMFMSLISWFAFQGSIDKLVERIDLISIYPDERLTVYRLVTDAISTNPWLGMGYGSFERSFKLYRDQSISSYFDKAHNTYLENIFELGFLQDLALNLSILVLVSICIRGVWVRRRNWIYPLLGVAVSVLVATHSMLDFSLQIPAISYLYALIMGACVAQSISSRADKIKT
jgi:O-antigen ligase